MKFAIFLFFIIQVAGLFAKPRGGFLGDFGDAFETDLTGKAEGAKKGLKAVGDASRGDFSGAIENLFGGASEIFGHGVEAADELAHGVSDIANKGKSGYGNKGKKIKNGAKKQNGSGEEYYDGSDEYNGSGKDDSSEEESGFGAVEKKKGKAALKAGKIVSKFHGIAQKLGDEAKDKIGKISGKTSGYVNKGKKNKKGQNDSDEENCDGSDESGSGKGDSSEEKSDK